MEKALDGMQTTVVGNCELQGCSSP